MAPATNVARVRKQMFDRVERGEVTVREACRQYRMSGDHGARPQSGVAWLRGTSLARAPVRRESRPRRTPPKTPRSRGATQGTETHVTACTSSSARERTFTGRPELRERVEMERAAIAVEEQELAA